MKRKAILGATAAVVLASIVYALATGDFRFLPGVTIVAIAIGGWALDSRGA